MSGLDRSHVVILAVALTVLLAGCAGLVGDGTDAETPDDGDANDTDTNPDDTNASDGSPVDGVTASTLQSNTIETMNDLETASFEIEQQTDSGMEYTIRMNGTIDTVDEELEMTMDMGSLLGEKMETYVMGGTIYFQAAGTWYQMDSGGADLWNQQDSINQSKKLLEAGDLEVADTTTVDGNDVYVVDIDLDAEQYNSLLQNQSGQIGTGQGVDFEINSANVTQYIDTESNYIRRMEIDLSVDSAMGTVESSTTITWDEFNEPVDIELPPAAENATKIDDWEGFGNETRAQVSGVAG